jgi:hypothetical protein
MITRRTFVAQTAGVAIASLGVGRLLGQAAAGPTAITVYKSNFYAMGFTGCYGPKKAVRRSM